MSSTMQNVTIGKKPNPVNLTDVAAAKVADLLAEEDTEGLALRDLSRTESIPAGRANT